MRAAQVAAKDRNYQQLLGFLRVFGLETVQKGRLAQRRRTPSAAETQPKKEPRISLISRIRKNGFSIREIHEIGGNKSSLN
jgi:hypothetical protein